MYQAWSDSQSKAFIDLEQTLRALQDAQVKMRSYKGSMHWKNVSGKDYLYRTTGNRGSAKSLGRVRPKPSSSMLISLITSRR